MVKIIMNLSLSLSLSFVRLFVLSRWMKASDQGQVTLNHAASSSANLVN